MASPPLASVGSLGPPPFLGQAPDPGVEGQAGHGTDVVNLQRQVTIQGMVEVCPQRACILWGESSKPTFSCGHSWDKHSEGKIQDAVMEGNGAPIWVGG